mgnify:CR=1 FL=1
MKKEEEEFIGECYTNYIEKTFLCGLLMPGISKIGWVKFKKSQIKDIHENEYLFTIPELSMRNIWIPKEHIILYDAIYDIQREKIKKAYHEKPIKGENK